MLQDLDKFTFDHFVYQDKRIRFVLQDGIIWWEAQPICEILGIKTGHTAVAHQVDSKDSAQIFMPDKQGRYQQCYMVSTAGLFMLIITSRKPEAKPFQQRIADTLAAHCDPRELFSSNG